jgi:hypothetical protein
MILWYSEPKKHKLLENSEMQRNSNDKLTVDRALKHQNSRFDKISKIIRICELIAILTLFIIYIGSLFL